MTFFNMIIQFINKYQFINYQILTTNDLFINIITINNHQQ
jgi:hypothetical protein